MISQAANTSSSSIRLRVGSSRSRPSSTRKKSATAALSGRVVETVLASLRFDTFVMGADCVDPDLGLSTFREDEAHITRAMLDAANRVIVLADRSKLMKPSLHQICGLDRVDYLVTDLEPNDPLIARFEAHGVQVLTAEAEKELT